jgi:ankyrin repeat protein
MKKNKFLKISESIKIYFYGIKNKFKDDTQKGRDFYELSVCLQVGNIKKFDEFFLKRYNPISFISLIAPAIGNGKLETFLALEEKAIKTNKIEQFYETALDLVTSLNNLDVLKYLINNKLIDKEKIDYAYIINAYESDSKDVLNYLLYEFRVPTNNDLNISLKSNPIGKSYPEIIELIEKRDLMFQLKKDLNQEEKKPKPKKI